MGARVKHTEIGTVIWMGRKIVEILGKIKYCRPSPMVELVQDM
jgi:hypothetical protein